MERKGNEKDHIVKVIMPQMILRRQKNNGGPCKTTSFCYAVQHASLKCCI
jgi:hypothetical protein